MCNHGMRNAFVALATIAARERWCWKLVCTTCGHMLFRYGLLQLTNGIHPDSSQWTLRTHSDLQRNRLGPLPNGYSRAQQGVLAGIVSQADLRHLRECCQFPDWLGYLGLVLAYTEDVERETGVLTASLVPQLAALVSPAEKARIKERFSGGRRLVWNDLELLEQSIVYRESSAPIS